MARKPPPGGRPGQDADTPSAAEVEAAIERALDALRPRAPAPRRSAGGKRAKQTDGTPRDKKSD